MQLKVLFARSKNKCAFPGCSQPLVLDNDRVIGEICHIKAQSSGGPRYDPNLPKAQVHDISNLIVMCPTHHRKIDLDISLYTVERLRKIKDDHERLGLFARLFQRDDHLVAQRFVDVLSYKLGATYRFLSEGYGPEHGLFSDPEDSVELGNGLKISFKKQPFLFLRMTPCEPQKTVDFELMTAAIKMGRLLPFTASRFLTSDRVISKRTHDRIIASTETGGSLIAGFPNGTIWGINTEMFQNTDEYLHGPMSKAGYPSEVGRIVNMSSLSDILESSLESFVAFYRQSWKISPPVFIHMGVGGLENPFIIWDSRYDDSSSFVDFGTSIFGPADETSFSVITVKRRLTTSRDENPYETLSYSLIKKIMDGGRAITLFPEHILHEEPNSSEDSS